jgi:hypothetical protein
MMLTLIAGAIIGIIVAIIAVVMNGESGNGETDGD